VALQTFSDIVEAIMESVGIQSSDVNAQNKIKRFVNMIYMDEVVPFKRWTWLQKTTAIVHKAYYNVETAEVTPDSATVTLSVAPSASLGSFKGYNFSVDDSNQIYPISAHTAGSATLTLARNFQEELDADADYKIWKDNLALPTDAKETIDAWHTEHAQPLKAAGPQELRKYQAAEPKREGFPSCYNTWDFIDPSGDDAEGEGDRYRQMRIFPSITEDALTINIDYIQEATELEDDADEPILPIGDRIVLFYGAGALAWSILSRNEEMHDKWQAKYQAKLARMAGDKDEGFDSPQISIKGSYVNSIRRGRRRGRLSAPAAGGGSAAQLPTYLTGVTIEGANLTDDVTADDGVLVDGRDLSEDGEILDLLTAPTSVTLTDNTTNQIVASWDVTEFDSIFIRYSLDRGAGNKEVGFINLVTDGTSASISQGGIADLGTLGVTFSTTVSSGDMVLLSTTTSTGTAATFQYVINQWLG
jgi:hypothetical protein